MKVWLLGLFPIAAGLFAQDIQNLPLVQEGGYWVRTTPEMTAALRPRLYVSTNGHVTVRGGDGNQISWKVKQRVRASSEAAAQRYMGILGLAPQVVGGWTRLTFTPVAAGFVITELEISVPRQMVSVFVQTQSGRIEAYDIDGDVQAKTLSGSIQMDRIGGNVLSAQTGGGDIRLGKIGGYVRQCGTEAGSISIASSGGAINCATAGGEIAVKEGGGAVTLSSNGGNIQVDSAAGPVRAESAAGMVRVRNASGPINIATVMGNILAELIAGANLRDSSLVAGAGDIIVLIPSNVGVSVMARNSSGGTPRVIHSDFSEIQITPSKFFRMPMVAQGSINGGGPMLMVDAEGGGIYLRRAK